MRDDLSIRERAIDAGAHRAEISLPELGADRRARELPIRQADAVLGGGRGHLAQELAADLVAEPARAAVDRREDMVLGEAERGRGFGVEDLDDVLDLEIVIARPERAHLVALARFRPLRDVRGLRAADAAALLDPLEIRGRAVALLDRPACAAREHRVHLVVVEADPSGAADAGRNVAKE